MSKSRLPTEQHFKQLSRRGLVAFAARCVRRFQKLAPPGKSQRDIEQIVQSLWQFPSDLADEPDAEWYCAQIEIQRARFELDVVLKACETALDALRESGETVLERARDLAVATYDAARENGHDISRLIRHDVKALYGLAPGPFPEVGGPFEELDLEVLSPLWPDSHS
jgi:hypothetical protein